MFADFVNLDTIAPSRLGSVHGFGIRQWRGLAR